MRSVLALASTLVLFAACGGSDSGSPDAAGAPDATVVPDAVPGPDACPGTLCPAFDFAPGVCVDTTTDEQHCGDCTTVCTGGRYCDNTCMCPPGFVPDSPVLGLTQVQSLGGQAILGFGLYTDPVDSMPDGLVTIYAVGTTAPVTLDFGPTPGQSLPAMAAGYHVMINGQSATADAAYYATAGTITFDTICDGGFSGHADNVTFTGVNGLMDPTIPQDACSFQVTGPITFAYGNACP